VTKKSKDLVFVHLKAEIVNCDLAAVRFAQTVDYYRGLAQDTLIRLLHWNKSLTISTAILSKTQLKRTNANSTISGICFDFHKVGKPVRWLGVRNVYEWLNTIEKEIYFKPKQ